MTDQAFTLRQIASQKTSEIGLSSTTAAHLDLPAIKRNSRSIAVTSGKGGVGKTNFAVNVSIALAALNNQVVLVDADMGLANADLLCGVHPKKHLGHVLANKCRLDETIIKLSSGVRLVPSGSGVEALANASVIKNPQLLAELNKLEESSDFTVIDTAAGIAENVMTTLLAASEVVVMTMPEPTAIVDAYAMIKVIDRHDSAKPISLVVNNVVGIREAEAVFQQLNSACKRFLNRNLAFLGAIPQDSQLVEAVCEQVPVIEHAPNSPASRALRLIARQILEESGRQSRRRAQVQSFWRLLLMESQN